MLDTRQELGHLRRSHRGGRPPRGGSERQALAVRNAATYERRPRTAPVSIRAMEGAGAVASRRPGRWANRAPQVRARMRSVRLGPSATGHAPARRRR